MVIFLCIGMKMYAHFPKCVQYICKCSHMYRFNANIFTNKVVVVYKTYVYVHYVGVYIYICVGVFIFIGIIYIYVLFCISVYVQVCLYIYMHLCAYKVVCDWKWLYNGCIYLCNVFVYTCIYRTAVAVNSLLQTDILRE